VAEYIVQSGGKRLRPALVLLSAGALGYRGRHHHELAAVSNSSIRPRCCMTTWSMSRTCGAAVRRPMPCSAIAASVLVGDFLYSRAFQMMVAVDDMRVMQVLSDATNVIAEGEVLQLMNCHDAMSMRRAICRSFATRRPSCSRRRRNWGRSSVAVTPRSRRRWPIYGMHLGTAFQLIDDVLDYSGCRVETGKHLGDDLAEGKPTLPLIYVCSNGNPEQAACVRAPSRTAAAMISRWSWRHSCKRCAAIRDAEGQGRG
jgi:octaprenyl-diphosphate synthase